MVAASNSANETGAGTPDTSAQENFGKFALEGAHDMDVFYDAKFRVRRKSGTYKEIPTPSPSLEYALADSHAHLSMLTASDLSLARAAAHGVDFVCCISDIAEDAAEVYAGLEGWIISAGVWLDQMRAADATIPAHVPTVRLSCGCHPHHASAYTNALEQALLHKLVDARTCCLGEIGLDYHYDFSPREVQREVFARQVQLAHRTGLPVALHIREAHDDAFAIMAEQGFPEAGAIVHCYTLGPDEVVRWLEQGCYIAVGGAVTFNKLDELREAVRIIPREQLLFETDAPFMTPVPLRGTECGPEHIIFTAAFIAETCGIKPGEDRKAFLQQIHRNTIALLDRGQSPWQSSTP